MMFPVLLSHALRARFLEKNPKKRFICVNPGTLFPGYRRSVFKGFRMRAAVGPI
jgi:hypothetical protein